MKLFGLGALALALLATVPALGRDVTAGALLIRAPWARATPGGAEVGGGYVTIENHGTVPDRLTGGSLAAAAGFALHAMSSENGIMRMRPTGPLEIPPGGALTLGPAGDHIMFTGLRHGLKAGDAIPGTLVFERAGTVPVTFAVEGLGAKGPSSAGQGARAMPGMDMK